VQVFEFSGFLVPRNSKTMKNHKKPGTGMPFC